MSERGPRLRLICINDVYTLENLPRFRTLVQHQLQEGRADVTLVTLAGDFLAPSMLSSLDSGRGMVDCLNAVPVTHVCLGNHEDDVPFEELKKRIAEYAGSWLSTNVVGLDPKLAAFALLDVGAEGTRTVRVGLIGVVMDDPTTYRAPPFGGAELLPANDTVLSAAKMLLDERLCDAVIPLTHQDMPSDRLLAARVAGLAIPVIVGGHEHEPFVETAFETTIVKAGADAVAAVIVDLEWPAQKPNGFADRPTVRTQRLEVASFDEDPLLRERVDRHMRAVHALEHATLLRLTGGETLSSIGTRHAQTSLGTRFCSLLRDELGADTCVFNGGGIRGNHEYRDRFTYGDLKAEVPFDNEVVVASIPGTVLAAAIVASRAQAPNDSGAFLQVDDQTTLDERNHPLTIAGAPFDPARDYRVALVRNLFLGMDHIDPLLQLAKAEPARIPPEGSGREVKMLLVDALSLGLFEQLGSFESVDENHDGALSPEELSHAIARATAEPASEITVELLLRAVDRDKSRAITRDEADEAERRAKRLHPR